MQSSADKGKNTKEFAIQFDKFVNSSVHVKLSGGRQVVGILRSHDALFNLVLDDAVETLTRGDEPATTRRLGQLICRGPCVLAVNPVHGSMQIENPFIDKE
ncbi:hypothetical protein MDAP_000791 [Mitosporidium daphniae]|uniref:Sm domain-containing protein n=1 Tax=Mitosporidium daphniae TaxID=1485682 RepID=A0A098VUU4_9MICR|nr:uncharacterized protein DI09_34p70 [Mitosporidium daphniae]KGG51456.1 hypothetical protein DI09_34p70 [Mitosporidium daphniae]|eukprot:XP_013237910.1 uncharacterized protein DI09_34p70 [Mitosporidium daphniae]